MLFRHALVGIAVLSSQLSTVLGRSITTDSADLVKKDYNRPPAFGRTFNKGERLIAAMMNPPNPADIQPRSLVYLYMWAALKQEFIIPGGETSLPQDAELPAQKFGWDFARPWHHTRWSVENNAMFDTVSETWFDDVSKTLIVEASWNEPMREVFDKQRPQIPHSNLPYHSEIWVDAYDNLMATGQHIKYVMRDNIVNVDTLAILHEARRLLKPSAGDKVAVEVRRESGDIAERESFIALAGTDNGATVFRMMTDRHNLLGNRKVGKVWLWGADRGQCDLDALCLETMVWELE